MSLGLGVVAIYGVMAYVSSHRTREIGIRLALGVLLAAAAFASYVPARRAASIDPIETLKME